MLYTLYSAAVGSIKILNKSFTFWYINILTLPYLTSGVDRLLHLPSAEAISVRPSAHPRM